MVIHVREESQVGAPGLCFFFSMEWIHYSSAFGTIICSRGSIVLRVPYKIDAITKFLKSYGISLEKGIELLK